MEQSNQLGDTGHPMSLVILIGWSVSLVVVFSVSY